MHIGTSRDDAVREEGRGSGELVSWKGIGLLAVLFVVAFGIGALFYTEEARFTVDEAETASNAKTEESGLRSHLYAEESKVDQLQNELRAAQRTMATQRLEIAHEKTKEAQIRQGVYKGKYQRAPPQWRTTVAPVIAHHADNAKRDVP